MGNQSGRVTMTSTNKRYAIVEGKSVREVAAYLPSSYTAREWTARPLTVLIEGTDRAGWTLDDYVIPRLASGLIVAREVPAGLVERT
jgi:hypothetical protein